MKESEEVGQALSGPAIEDYREHYSESRFWGKIGSLPGNTGRLLVQKSIELFVIRTDRDTPVCARLLIMGAHVMAPSGCGCQLERTERRS